MQQDKRCLTCNGVKRTPCNNCHGEGVNLRFPDETCAVCVGQRSRTCRTCRGKGRIKTEALLHKLEFKIKTALSTHRVYLERIKLLEEIEELLSLYFPEFIHQLENGEVIKIGQFSIKQNQNQLEVGKSDEL